MARKPPDRLRGGATALWSALRRCEFGSLGGRKKKHISVGVHLK